MRPNDPHSPRPCPGPLGRREFLWRVGGGLGGIALTQLLGRQGLLGTPALAADSRPTPRLDLNGGIHHRAKIKRVVQLFMNGGASQVDTFDHKPLLAARHGQAFNPGRGARVESTTGSVGTVMASPFAFKQRGHSGRWVSDALPHTAGVVDDLAFLMAMQSKTNVHGPGVYLQNTGFVAPGFPCLGAWVSYALGGLGDNLPTFVVLPDPRGLPYNSTGSFSAGFLPAGYGGTVIKAAAPNPIADLFPPAGSSLTPAGEAEGLALLREMNRRHAGEHPGDSRLEARAAAYEMAARMQLSAPEVLDLAGESAATRELYGVDDPLTSDFARNCLIARRLLERGVRFVQVWSGTAGAAKNWDNHTDIARELAFIAGGTDQPTAALVRDLKCRGMLEDTLVIWTTEFGRMPFSQGGKGRDHNGGTFVSWLAGGGVRAGSAFGQSDEWGWKASTDGTWGYDLNATILHLLGIDHTKLTYRHNGMDRRLTDVHGRVVREILA